ncbi:short-chain dehydrogenase/reductase SDR [Sulfobacillus acidophilus DSM 10332]|uniref:Short-chain dehydrogenase/reductase SDR n=1 Tax=Sulfobacillus acidophilus (strain ATCC 700253 / DSM 10332 / NAL) TaxID=679936 RepID=G8TUV9_SULAD|nr:short-chain dehydrogenase/reductase SDR [Sulfobacillus acidophilus DSM 10332]
MKRVIVTGASGGIGTAFGRLARNHWQVIGTARQGPIALDVTWPTGAIETVFRQHAPYDAAVFLAGADILSPPLRLKPYEERLARLWQVDVEGSIKCSRAIRPYLNPGARLVFLGWDQAYLGKSGEAGELYALAKAAVTGYAKSLAQSWIKDATVYVVAPGWVKTRWGEKLPLPQASRIQAQTRAGVWQSPEEVAEVIWRLLELPGDLMTGQVFYVNRGDVMPS